MYGHILRVRAIPTLESTDSMILSWFQLYCLCFNVVCIHVAYCLQLGLLYRNARMQ